MNQFFTWSPDAVARTLGIAVAVLCVSFLLMAWRAALLVKLGTRNLARRRLRAVLIVCGLMLGTTVVGSAFGTGDALTHALQALVAGSLGTVDEVIVLNPPRTRLAQQVRALAQPGLGGLAAADLQFFGQDQFTQLADQTRGSTALAALAPGIVGQVSVVNAASQQLRSGIALLAVPAPYPAAFGSLQAAANTPVPFASLGADEVIINAAAADTLGAQAGGTLGVLHDGATWNVRVHAVVQNGGLAGLQPVVLVPLPRYQQVTGHAGQINNILVVNPGGAAGVARSAGAARDLRQVLVNRPAAEQLHALLARPDIQRSLQDVESAVRERDRARLVALRTEAARPDVSADFISSVTDPRVRQRLLSLARRVGGGREASGLLENVASLSVLTLKQDALDQAQDWGAVITTVFLLLGIFSIAAAILLIFLIFALLAADRSAELATVRAIGMRRHQVMGMFLSEGLVYNVAGAALGTLASLASGYLIVRALSSALDSFGVRLSAGAEPRSLVIAFCGGVVLAFAAMLVAAWRVSDVDIVAATRGEQIDSQRWHTIAGVVLLIVAGGLWWRWRSAASIDGALNPLLLPSAITLTLLGALLCAAALPWRPAQRQIGGVVATLSGAAISAAWLWALLQLPSANGDVRGDVLTLALGGVVLSLAVGWTTVRALGPLVKVLDQAAGPWTALRAVLRPAAGYLSGERWRTGLTVLMFGMVVLIMVAALTLLNVVSNAYAAGEAPVAGFELRADLPAGTPITDMEQALTKTSAVGRNSFSAIGGVAVQDVQSVQLGVERAEWQSATLAVANNGFLGGIQASMDRHAAGYANDRAAWAALANQPGTAVVTARGLGQINSSAGDGGTTMQPWTVWVRPAQGGQPVKLSVLGVVNARSELDEGIYTSQATAAGLGVPIAAPRTYFFAVQGGVRTPDAADGLRISFADQGIGVTDLGDQARIIATVRLLLTRLVQGFMGLGLLAGVAALALLGGQAVIERRQQLGTLRALGFTRRQLRMMLGIESAVIAALGIGLGVVLGLFLARSVVRLLSTTYFELHYAVPWGNIATIIAVAWLGSTLAMLIAAWYAGRVSPADALRSGS